MALTQLLSLSGRQASVYFFYNPDLRALELGKLSALVEIALTQHLATLKGPMRYYDMNYYVHQCSRMTYKRQYKPSELLCPVHFKWVELDAVVNRLDDDKFAALADVSEEEANAAHADAVILQSSVVPQVMNILPSGSAARFGELSSRGQELLFPYMEAFVRAAGPTIASCCVVDPRLMLVRAVSHSSHSCALHCLTSPAPVLCVLSFFWSLFRSSQQVASSAAPAFSADSDAPTHDDDAHAPHGTEESTGGDVVTSGRDTRDDSVVAAGDGGSSVVHADSEGGVPFEAVQNSPHQPPPSPITVPDVPMDQDA